MTTLVDIPNSMEKDFNLESYDYSLPEELIAARPDPDRHNSKLLVYNQKDDSITHTTFKEIHKFLPKDSLLVLNKSKVYPCRIYGKKKTGGRVEIFVLDLVEKDGGYLCLLKSTGKKYEGLEILIDDVTAKIVKVHDNGSFQVEFKSLGRKINISNFLDQKGKVPIPPYIRGGESDDQDKSDYQTVYAENEGSVAAPTAGLHFTEEVFNNLKVNGIDKAFVTLHVGMGTFAPVKSDDIRDHDMHFEEYTVDKTDAERITNANDVFCVGTTSLRVLETCKSSGSYNFPEPGVIENTNIFLYPGKEVKSISGMVTNFHLPKSSLIMLVSALLGREKTLELYQEAIKNKYRFYSYGDAMLILRDMNG